MRPIPALKQHGAAQSFRAGWDKGRGGPDKTGQLIPVAIVGFGGTEKEVQAVVVDADGKMSATGLAYLTVVDPEVLAAVDAAVSADVDGQSTTRISREPT